EESKITTSGHETTDTDPGLATTKDDYSLEAYILGTNHYQIELLTNLDQVPEFGAIVVISFPKPKGGSGFPARVFAILPRRVRLWVCDLLKLEKTDSQQLTSGAVSQDSKAHLREKGAALRDSEFTGESQ